MRKLVLTLAAAAVAAAAGPAHAGHHSTMKVSGICGNARFTVAVKVDPVKDTLKLKYTVNNAPAGAVAECGYSCIGGGSGANLGCPDINGKGKLKFSTVIDNPQSCTALLPYVQIHPLTCYVGIP